MNSLLSFLLIPELLKSLLDGLDGLGYAALAALILAAIPALLFLANICLFRRPGRPYNKRLLPPISVLIPARNEERSIAAAIKSVLASRGVELELIVLDDGSTDRTAEIVRALAEKDSRVRLETAPLLPDGWNGKQHACWMLASLAAHDVFCFLDADVRVGREAIYHMVSELNYLKEGEPEMAMASGFPCLETRTFLQSLLLPLIHFVLLGFLPLAGERWSGWSGFAAGCGQFMMIRREPYFKSGGHSANPTTMHDGLLLPQLFRRHGFRTGVYDLSRDARCRVYSTASEVWSGLAKNATEGMASLGRLPVFTVFLFVGQVLPLPLAVMAYVQHHSRPLKIAVLAMVLGYLMRFFNAWRYRQSWRGAFLHPLGVLILLVLQWYAFARKLFGLPATWKQRAYRVG
jgi:cellulose synthase/poly-beta-1,6-N-acetylglucosamine synthase-like glycosyltransferase